MNQISVEVDILSYSSFKWTNILSFLYNKKIGFSVRSFFLLSWTICDLTKLINISHLTLVKKLNLMNFSEKAKCINSKETALMIERSDIDSNLNSVSDKMMSELWLSDTLFKTQERQRDLSFSNLKSMLESCHDILYLKWQWNNPILIYEI